MENVESIELLLNSPLEVNIILGASLAEHRLGWDYMTIYNNIGQPFLDAIAEDACQEKICKMCEEQILECSSMSYHFMCEGCSCEEANELFIEQYIENLL